MSEEYICPKCGYYMALAPLKNVRVIHRKDGTHDYRTRRLLPTQQKPASSSSEATSPSADRSSEGGR